MSRPQKKGLGYYPQDVDLFANRKIKKLIAEFGAAGYLIYECIKARCYKENGYWAAHDENFCFDIADTVKAGITEQQVSDVLQACVTRLGLFHEKVFRDSRVITSAGIQQRYIGARRYPVIVPEIWVIAAKTPVKAAITAIKPAENTQRKEEKSKGALDTIPLPLPAGPALCKVHEFFFRHGRPDKKEAEKFFYHYDALGWRIGVTPIYNWQSMASKWIANPLEFSKKESPPSLTQTEIELLAKYPKPH